MKLKNASLVGTFTMFSFISVLTALATDYYVSHLGWQGATRTCIANQANQMLCLTCGTHFPFNP